MARFLLFALPLWTASAERSSVEPVESVTLLPSAALLRQRKAEGTPAALVEIHEAQEEEKKQKEMLDKFENLEARINRLQDHFSNEQKQHQNPFEWSPSAALDKLVNPQYYPHRMAEHYWQQKDQSEGDIDEGPDPTLPAELSYPNYLRYGHDVNNKIDWLHGKVNNVLDNKAHRAMMKSAKYGFALDGLRVQLGNVHRSVKHYKQRVHQTFKDQANSMQKALEPAKELSSKEAFRKPIPPGMWRDGLMTTLAEGPELSHLDARKRKRILAMHRDDLANSDYLHPDVTELYKNGYSHGFKDASEGKQHGVEGRMDSDIGPEMSESGELVRKKTNEDKNMIRNPAAMPAGYDKHLGEQHHTAEQYAGSPPDATEGHDKNVGEQHPIAEEVVASPHDALAGEQPPAQLGNYSASEKDASHNATDMVNQQKPGRLRSEVASGLRGLARGIGGVANGIAHHAAMRTFGYPSMYLPGGMPYPSMNALHGSMLHPMGMLDPMAQAVGAMPMGGMPIAQPMDPTMGAMGAMGGMPMAHPMPQAMGGMPMAGMPIQPVGGVPFVR